MAYISPEHQLKTLGLKHSKTFRFRLLPLELSELDPPPASDGRVIEAQPSPSWELGDKIFQT